MERSGFQRPQTTQDAVLEELRERITTGLLPPGTQLLQETLATEFGVSRAPVRDALKILVGEGLVQTEAHRRYSVRRLSISDLREIYRIRALLEDELALAAAPKATAELVATLEEYTSAMEHTHSLTDLQRLNRDFHFAIYSAAELPHFLEHVRGAWDRTDQYRALYYTASENLKRACQEHRGIIEAIRLKDGPMLKSLLHAHREHAIENVVASLEQVLDPDSTAPGSNRQTPSPTPPAIHKGIAAS